MLKSSAMHQGVHRYSTKTRHAMIASPMRYCVRNNQGGEGALAEYARLEDEQEICRVADPGGGRVCEREPLGDGPHIELDERKANTPDEHGNVDRPQVRRDGEHG